MVKNDIFQGSPRVEEGRPKTTHKNTQKTQCPQGKKRGLKNEI
jgi:hypothetical protein